ncbi:MAG: polysaccharide biosynthesis/export family protein [Parachlamydiaceae bacterium]|nr:polysaccharide biosynthesis/export family protein [Parachlamydiaceae bacterium]
MQCKTIRILSSLLLLLCTSCCKPCHNYPIMGADDFVIDSYQIRQGKFAILEMEGIEVEELPSDAMCEYEDTIAEDDILNIVLYHPSRKDLMESIQFINHNVGGFRVRQGQVDLPDISYVPVAGLTLDEARIRLQEEYRKQIQDVELFVTYQDRLTRKVELTGMVGTPTVPVDGKIRLYEVIAHARIPTDANLFLSYVVRNCQPLAVDLHKLINEGDMSQNIVMRGGDKVFIANKKDSNVMVMGEINNSQPVHMSNGYMSLREALVSAGGIPFTGDKRHIQVIRGNLKCPKIYVLAWEHIIHLPNDSLLLIPGDTVYVSASPITEWNRFISQLLPSAQAFQTGNSVYRIVNY